MKRAIQIIIFVSLFISGISIAKNYKGAEYRTKTAYTYGRFEVRMIPVHRSGVVTSFFTYHEISNTSEWNEIDIENIGRYDDQIQFNTITPNQLNHVRNNATGFNPYEDYHVYAFEWTPFYVAWFIDDVEVYRQTGSHIGTLNKAQKIMMNLWISDGDNWVGPWDDSSLPAFAYYDWVKYYSYTQGTGNYGTDNNFTLDWSDEFDSFDSNRWQKASHTFNGNLVDFDPENIVFQDGKMILCLTDTNNKGYTDVSKPIALWAKSFQDGKIEVNFSEKMDKSTAEISANYSLTNATVLSALLSNDKSKIFLSTENYDPTTATNLIILNVTDQFGNSISPAATSVITANYLEVPAKINVGGNAVLGYLADQDWDETKTYGHISEHNSNWSAGINIIGTSEDNIYLNDRDAATKYILKVPNGHYKLTFMFAEKYWDQTGKRIFDVYVENELKIANLDIFAAAGKNTAYNVAIETDVSDEQVDIILSPKVDLTTLSGIKIESTPTSVGEVGIPKQFELFQNYPNPFNPSTNIKFNVAKEGKYQLSIFNLNGEKVSTIVNKFLQIGIYTFAFNAEKLSSGVYFYSLLNKDNKMRLTDKMLLLK